MSRYLNLEIAMYLFGINVFVAVVKLQSQLLRRFNQLL